MQTQVNFFLREITEQLGLYLRSAWIRTWSDWIRTEGNFGQIRTGSDCIFFGSGQEWTEKNFGVWMLFF